MKIIKTIFALALAALTLSCSNLLDDSGDSSSFLPPAGDGMAWISVNVTNQEKSTRTLIPTIEISDLVLKGGLTGTEEKVLASAESLAQMESRQIVIQTGEWSFTLTAKVSGKEFTSRAVTKTIESGQENPLSFTLEPVNTSGELDFTINFTGRSGLEYEAAVLVDDDALTSFSQEAGKCNIKSDFTEGSHTIEIQFRAKNVDSSSAESEILNIYKSIFRIKRGVTTKAVVDNFNLNEVYSIDYEGFDSSADSIAAGEKMILKFSRKYTESAGSEGYITLPRLSNSNMTFSGWYTSAINSEGTIDKYAALVPLYDASGNPAPADTNPTDPLYTQKIKVSDNLSDQTLYAKWLINAGGNVALASDYKFNFKFLQNNDSDTAARGFYPGQAGKFKLSAEVKLGDEVQTIPASDITWTIKLLNGGIVTDKTPSYENGILTIPAITLQDKYTLKVRVDYLGIAHDASFDYDVSYAAENAAAWISSLAAAGSYDVKVEGGVASGENEGLAQVAKAIKARPAGVYINLDAAGTSASSEITSYNDGQYFKDCSALKSIRLPSWMEYVIHDLFNGCTSLESISMSESTQYIGKDAFKDCTSLTSITLPKDITGASSGSHIHGIDTGAFAGCTSLADIYYEGTISDWAGVKQGSGWYKDVPASVIHCIDGDTAINALAATPLTLEAKEAGAKVTFSNKASGPVTYRLNGETAQTIASGKSAEINLTAVGDKVAFYGDNATYATSLSNYSNITCSADCYVYGNIMSLIDSSDFANETTLTENHAFANLFYNNTKIKNKSGESLLLPATTLTGSCYHSMFEGCTGLTEAPELPATTITDFCYRLMFSGCTGLTTAPELPAAFLFNAARCYDSMFYRCTSLTTAPELPSTELSSNCYDSMFYGCTSLTTAPALPATILAASCYISMFEGCTNLTSAPELPATNLLYDKCYKRMFYGCTSLTTAPALPATGLSNNCYESMFQGCTSLTSAPELPATTLEFACYNAMFQDCTSLTTAPELPATTLTINGYKSMFYGCTSLTVAPELPATTLATSCYNSMFYGCTSLTSAPALPATTLETSCYETMFEACTSLTTAPELPATTLVSACYNFMFYGCTNLNKVTCLATDISADYCTNNWLSGVAATGTFISSADILGWSRDESGIPSGWTVVNYVAPFSAENLTADNYATVTEITLDSAEGMTKLITLANSTNAKTFEGKTITLEANVELSAGQNFVTEFKGTFDGNGKTISGLAEVAGLFTDVNGTIKNLTIEGSSTRAGLAVYFTNGLIEGCTSRVSVNQTGNDHAAGIAAFMGNGSSPTIRNCVNEGTIKSSSSYLGGIAGRENVSGCIIDSCVNKGMIEYTGSGNSLVGGIVGSTFGIVRNCINNGVVKGGNAYQVGGISGAQHGDSAKGVLNCANLASVSAKYQAGGIAGVCDIKSYNANIQNCFNAGSITITDSSKESAGGILGEIIKGGSTSHTCTLTSNYSLPGTAAMGGIGVTNSVTVTAPSMSTPSVDEMNTWVNDNNSGNVYKTWIIKSVGSTNYPVPNLGYDW